jgi:hypothetical protein
MGRIMSVEAFARILSCCALIGAGAVVLPLPAMAEPPPAQAQPSAPSACIDDMETEPDYDDQQAMPVSDTVDGGCLISPEPISI